MKLGANRVILVNRGQAQPLTAKLPSKANAGGSSSGLSKYLIPALVVVGMVMIYGFWSSGKEE